MRQRWVRRGKGERRRSRSFGRCLEFYLRHFTTVPRLRRHCSAVKSRNTQTVLSCDSPRSAADRGESVLKPNWPFLSLVGTVACRHCNYSAQWVQHMLVNAKNSFGIRRDSGGIQAGFGGIQAGFKRDSSGIRRDSSGIQLLGTYISYGFPLNPSGIQPSE